MTGQVDVAGDDVTLRALTWGDWDAGDSPVAVCLHGFPDTAHGWRKVAPQLADAGWRVVAPFMRGYAPSSLSAEGSYHVGALMDDAPRVPETIRLGPLLLELRAFGHQMAVVVDEYGGTSGAVTLEDVVEELVGDVADEHDPRGRTVLPGGERTWVVAGTLRPDELHHETGLVVPDESPYETLGGLVMTTLGRLPRVGDEVSVPGVQLRVERMDGRRVDSIRVTAVDDEPEEQE